MLESSRGSRWGRQEMEVDGSRQKQMGLDGSRWEWMGVDQKSMEVDGGNWE